MSESPTPPSRADEKSARVLAAIGEHWAAKGYPPSFRWLCQRTGISSTSMISYHLKRLKKAGLVIWEKGESRTIRLVEVSE